MRPDLLLGCAADVAWALACVGKHYAAGGNPQPQHHVQLQEPGNLTSASDRMRIF